MRHWPQSKGKKLHREAEALFDQGKYREASQRFFEARDAYMKNATNWGLCAIGFAGVTLVCFLLSVILALF